MQKEIGYKVYLASYRRGREGEKGKRKKGERQKLHLQNKRTEREIELEMGAWVGQKYSPLQKRDGKRESRLEKRPKIHFPQWKRGWEWVGLVS